MSTTTGMLWTDCTVNPVMGCDGCELFLGPDVIYRHLDEAIGEADQVWKPGTSRRILALMARFAKSIGGFPENVCAMTPLVDGEKSSLQRLRQLKVVSARMRGLSLEPLLGRIDPRDLDLAGIDWAIVGGESGNDTARPFDLEWARAIRGICRKAGVAFFMKQLGRTPVVNGRKLRLSLDKSHGGNWTEWPDDLKVREMPEAFLMYRPLSSLVTVASPQGRSGARLPPVEKRRFRELNRTVLKASRGVIDAAIALAEIKRDRLYRARRRTFDGYCQSVLSFSRQYAYRLIQAGNAALEMSTRVDAGLRPDIPRKESHLQALAGIKDPRRRADVCVELAREVKRTGVAGEPNRWPARRCTLSFRLLFKLDGSAPVRHCSTYEKLFQTGSIGRVPVPPRKRRLINQWKETLSASVIILFLLWTP